ncbi:MAG: relaxase/mobilization nuclease domain-containing protein [Bacteroidia bacterium]|nr:relaxase/mobilization nuclease domain-containing protein [Bacteroidia bacterium]
MIIKSKGYRSQKAIENVIRYCAQVNKVQNQAEPFLHTRFIRNPNDLKSVIQTFEMNESFRVHKRKNTNAIIMEIISFHKDDSPKLNPMKLRKLAQYYLEKRAPHAMALCTLHTDQDHIHLHLCLSGVSFATGKATRIARSDFATLKQEMERYQERQLGLVHSRIDHTGKDKQERELTLSNLRRDESLDKVQLGVFVRKVLESSISYDQFVRKLEDQNIQLYNRGSEASGIIHQGKKYRWRTLNIDKSLVLDRIEKDRAIDRVQKRMLALEDMESIKRNHERKR